MEGRPTFGYKLVNISNGRYGIAKLHIPEGSTIVETDYKMSFRGMPDALKGIKLMRTNRVMTTSIIPTGGTDKDMVSTGKSIRTHCPLTYSTGNYTVSDLNTVDGHGDGIHFFWEETGAKLWISMFK